MGASYWSQLQERRGSRRTVLRGLTLSAAASAAALAGCSSTNSKKNNTAVQPAAPSVGRAAATPGATTAPAGTTAAATRAAGDFLSTLPENPPDPLTDADIRAGGTLLRLYDRQITFDFMTTTSTAPVAEVTLPVYSRLVRLACRSNMKTIMQPELEADLATSWEQPDKTTVVLTLAPGIKWQNVKPLNGRAFSIDDVKSSMNRGKTLAKSVWKGYYNHIAKVDDAGGGKVAVTLDGPYPAILQALASNFMAIMPPEIGDNPDVANTTAVGTGGFIMTKNTPNVEFVYQKNPDYFKTDSTGKKRPYIDGYSLSVVTDPATQLGLFESGKADFAYSTASPINFDNVQDFARRNPKMVLQKHTSSVANFALVGHLGQAPWSDVRVRQAANLCVDRETTINKLLRGQAYVGPWFPWPYIFDRAPTLKDLGPNYAFDPKQAKQLLAAAGFPNGLDLDVAWYVSGDVEQMLTLYQQTAAQAGLRINLVKSPDNASHSQKQVSKAWTGLLMAARAQDFVDPSATMSYFQPGNSLNYGDVNDPVLVDLNGKLENSLGDDRKAVGRQIWDYLNSQVYDVTLPIADSLSVFSPRLHNWRDTVWSANTGKGAGSIDQIWVSA